MRWSWCSREAVGRTRRTCARPPRARPGSGWRSRWRAGSPLRSCRLGLATHPARFDRQRLSVCAKSRISLADTQCSTDSSTSAYPRPPDLPSCYSGFAAAWSSVRGGRYLLLRHIHHPLTRGGPTNRVRPHLRRPHIHEPTWGGHLFQTTGPTGRSPVPCQGVQLRQRCLTSWLSRASAC